MKNIFETAKEVLSEGQLLPSAWPKKLIAAIFTAVQMGELRAGKPYVYLSAFEKDYVKKLYGERLPRGMPSATRGLHISTLLYPYLKKDVTIEGDRVIVGDSKVIMRINQGSKMSHLAHAAGIKLLD